MKVAISTKVMATHKAIKAPWFMGGLYLNAYGEGFGAGVV